MRPACPPAKQRMLPEPEPKPRTGRKSIITEYERGIKALKERTARSERYDSATAYDLPARFYFEDLLTPVHTLFTVTKTTRLFTRRSFRPGYLPRYIRHQMARVPTP